MYLDLIFYATKKPQSFAWKAQSAEQILILTIFALSEILNLLWNKVKIYTG
jgi:hypothetical protein